ncbi:alpha-galactosidase-like protein [Nonomuraea polychroma]|uniref:Alpha-galactosidase-like protein n=1 Tax=Nonomuraea polychroma TaxID=46176 RepID=A0A438MR45_9ACTN|nr:NEW3 domain-containing protein [Nonomuraea polychroma]RVX47895.1 alpha-galactosidase-like protein [Nonomuraea polychroma]
MRPLFRFLPYALVALLALGTLNASPAYAQTLTLTTPYPSLEVEPGENVSLDLDVSGSPAGQVELDVDAPKGWKTTLRGGGYVVSSVHAGKAEVTLDVAVPAEAKGTHKVTVTAERAGGERARLPLTLTVRGTGAQAAVGLEAEFAKLTGKASDTFSYTVTLRNDAPKTTTFALAVQGPSGWNVSANPSSQQRATTVKVDGGSTATINVSADPPDDVAAGAYPIRLGVTGGGRQAAAELTAEVTGTVELELSTPEDRLNASGSTGQRTRVPLVLTNKGTTPLAGVTLSASPPSGWEVTFEPKTVDVAPQQQARVTAVIAPSDDAVTGDYMVTLTAEKDGQRSEADIRYTVETSRWWGLAGVLVIMAVAGGLWWVFRTFGRR